MKYQKTTTEEVRCAKCNRKLADAAYTHLSIKCPRCKTVNTLRATRPNHQSIAECPTEKEKRCLSTPKPKAL